MVLVLTKNKEQMMKAIVAELQINPDDSNIKDRFDFAISVTSRIFAGDTICVFDSDDDAVYTNENAIHHINTYEQCNNIIARAIGLGEDCSVSFYDLDKKDEDEDEDEE